MLRKAFENILRSWLTSFPTIIVLAVTLTLFHGLLLIHGKAKDMENALLQKFSVTVYLKTSASAAEVASLVAELDQRSDIIPPVVYTGSKEAFELMSKTFSLDPSLLKKYSVELPASLTITPKNPADVSRIESFLNDEAAHLLHDPMETKEKRKSVTDQMLRFLNDVRSAVNSTLVTFLIFFIIGGSLLMASAVSIPFTARKLEMGIMQLVGARRREIAAPFIAEGVLMAVFAWVLHAAATAMLGISLPEALQWNALLLELAAVIALGGAAAYATVKWHTR